GDGADRIIDFSAGDGDAIDLRGARIATYAGLLACAAQVGTDTVIILGNGDTLTLRDEVCGELNASSFIFAPGSAPSDITLSNSHVAYVSQIGTVVGSL